MVNRLDKRFFVLAISAALVFQATSNVAQAKTALQTEARLVGALLDAAAMGGTAEARTTAATRAITQVLGKAEAKAFWYQGGGSELFTTFLAKTDIKALSAEELTTLSHVIENGKWTREEVLKAARSAVTDPNGVNTQTMIAAVTGLRKAPVGDIARNTATSVGTLATPVARTAESEEVLNARLDDEFTSRVMVTDAGKSVQKACTHVNTAGCLAVKRAANRLFAAAKSTAVCGARAVQSAAAGCSGKLIEFVENYLNHQEVLETTGQMGYLAMLDTSVGFAYQAVVDALGAQQAELLYRRAIEKLGKPLYGAVLSCFKTGQPSLAGI